MKSWYRRAIGVALCFLAFYWSPTNSAPLARADSPSKANAGFVRVLSAKELQAHPTQGPKDAPVTIEFFVNFANARSAVLHQYLLVMAKRHPARLQIIYRLTETRKDSVSAAQSFAREAFEQGLFWEFTQAFYAKRGRPPAASQYEKVAKAAGINYAQVRKALTSLRHDKALSGNYHYWLRHRIRQVPAVRVNGVLVPRISNVESLESAYDYALAKSRNFGSGAVEALSKEITRRIPKDAGPIDNEEEDAPESPILINMSGLLSSGHAKPSKAKKLPTSSEVPIVFICHQQSILCRGMYKNLIALQESYPEVKLIIHPLYDVELLGQDKADLMYKATLCAGAQGAYFGYFDALFATPRRSAFDMEKAIELSKSKRLSLDQVQFETCLVSKAVSQRAKREVALVSDLGIKHTPSLAIGGQLFIGRLQFPEMQALLDAQLSPGLLQRFLGP